MKPKPWAALLNEKLVIPSTRGNYLAVDRLLLSQLLRPAIGSIHVDEAWYLNAYADVAEGVRQGIFGNAKAHYTAVGYFEHRMPYPISVEEEWYLAQYLDVGAAVSTRVFVSGQHHFDLLGYREGRFPYAGFTFEIENPLRKNANATGDGL